MAWRRVGRCDATHHQHQNPHHPARKKKSNAAKNGVEQKKNSKSSRKGVGGASTSIHPSTTHDPLCMPPKPTQGRCWRERTMAQMHACRLREAASPRVGPGVPGMQEEVETSNRQAGALSERGACIECVRLQSARRQSNTTK
jgi:hypothetical protein